MFKPKREKLTTTVTPEKTRQQKPFVQIEGELTEAQLEAYAGGAGDDGCPPWNCGDNHNETMFVFPRLSFHNSILKEVLMSKQKLKKFTATPDKTPPEKPLVELT